MMRLADSIRAEYCRYVLDFRFKAVTSRQAMVAKETYFIRLTDSASGRVGIGECALFRGLSAEDTPGYETKLQKLCKTINRGERLPKLNSSLSFGLETALRDLEGGGQGVIYPSDWLDGTYGIRINGLVWMGD